MKNMLSAMAVAALTFIHFKTPAGELLFVRNEFAPEGATQHADGYARDAQGNKLPVGVRAYGPGSMVYRKAEDAVATKNLSSGRNKLTGEQLRANATEVMARTVVEYVNFDYNGERVVQSMSMEDRVKINEKLLDDPEYVAVRDLISKEQGDLGNFSKAIPAA